MAELKPIYGFFFSRIYFPDDTEVSFLIQCSRAHQWTLHLVGVREPDVLHDFCTAFSACLAMLSVLCCYGAATGCCLCIAPCGPSRNSGVGGGWEGGGGGT